MKTKEPPCTERYARWCGRSVDKIIIYLLPDLFFARQNEMHILPKMLLDVADQFLVFALVGDALKSACIKHIRPTAVTDGEYLFFYLISHLSPQPSAHGRFRKRHSAQSRCSNPQESSLSNQYLDRSS